MTIWITLGTFKSSVFFVGSELRAIFCYVIYLVLTLIPKIPFCISKRCSLLGVRPLHRSKNCLAIDGPEVVFALVPSISFDHCFLQMFAIWA